MSIEAGRPTDGTTQTASEVELWLDILRQANQIHDALPASTRDEIDRGASPRELTVLAVHMASLSTETRSRIEAVLVGLLAPVNLPAAACPRLSLVPAG